MGGEANSSCGSSVGGFFLGMLVGAIVGGVTALLLAPKSGAETREMLKKRLSKMKEEAQTEAARAKEAMEQQ